MTQAEQQAIASLDAEIDRLQEQIDARRINRHDLIVARVRVEKRRERILKAERRRLLAEIKAIRAQVDQVDRLLGWA